MNVLLSEERPYKFQKLFRTDSLFESTHVGVGRVSKCADLFNNRMLIRVDCRTVDDSNFLTVPYKDESERQLPKTINLNKSVDALYRERQKEFRERMNREYYGYFD